LDDELGLLGSGALAPPDRLGSSGPARDAWEYLAPRLAHVGLLDRSDLMMLEACCTAWGRFQQARAAFAENPELIVQGSKGPIANPLLKIERDALDAFARIAERFGLDPSSRARLGLVGLQGLSLRQQLEAVFGDDDADAAPAQLALGSVIEDDAGGADDATEEKQRAARRQR
jgi:P27 family predicted phage terminase small subunit